VRAKNLKICGRTFKPGERDIVQVQVGNLYDFTEMNIPVEVIRGVTDGPTLFLSGAIHGDEINGVEIIRRILRKINPKKLRGSLLAVPVVNVFGFNTRSRYLPDRRDLNRAFPGNSKGSLAAQIAKKFMTEIVKKSTHGIDFHTGAIHRFNIPQIRAWIDDPKTKNLARAFNTKVVIHSQLRDGSLREAARKANIPILVFEGGEALRFDESVIKAGVEGTLSVMQNLGMIERKTHHSLPRTSLFVRDSLWVRAPSGGSMRTLKKAGDFVEQGEVLAHVLDLFGKIRIEVVSPVRGVIIGRNRLPLINRGDALYHIATSKVIKKTNQEFLDF
jgi:predicted deacylase